jgi:hypothetical protein
MMQTPDAQRGKNQPPALPETEPLAHSVERNQSQTLEICPEHDNSRDAYVRAGPSSCNSLEVVAVQFRLKAMSLRKDFGNALK